MPDRQKLRKIGAWLLAPVLATAAIAVQISLDVPRAPMLEHKPKKPKKPKKSAAARNAERKAKAAKSKTKTKKKRRQRGQRELTRLRKIWSEQALEDEPVDQHFRRRHESMLRSVVTRARARALDGAPPPAMQTRPTCHTIRCELELCGPSKLISAIADLLPGVTLDDQPLWHELREVEPTQAPVEPQLQRKPKSDRLCRRWIVDFAHDGGNVTKLAIPE